MPEYFDVVVFAVVAVGAIGAVATLFGRDGVYDQIGRGGLSLDRGEEDCAANGVSAPVSPAVAEEEIRQMLTARNDRLARRGQPQIDVDTELHRLLDGPAAPASADPALVAEVRSLVIARNERRARAGREPLDIEVEVARQLADFEGA